MNRYKLLTVTHKSVPLSQLGQFYIARKSSQDAVSGKLEAGQIQECDSSVDGFSEESAKWQRLEALKAEFSFEDLFYMETCNRVIYFFTSEEDVDADFLTNFFSFVNPVLGEAQPHILQEHVKVFEGHTSLRHLFEVATSLDSLVIGEREILGQLRSAYESCWDKGLIGDMLRIAFKFAIPAAKEVYTETRIAEKPVSVVSLAARRIRDSRIPKDARIALVGAGQTMQLMGKFLSGFGFTNFQVFNRSFERAEILAEELKGSAHTLADFEKASQEHGLDVIATCTGSIEPVITESAFDRWNSLPRQLEKPLVVDLAVPADVERSLSESNKLRYLDLEELRDLAEKNLQFRREEVSKARKIVERRVSDFERVFRDRQIERVFSSLPADMKSLRSRAVDSVFREEVDAMDEQSRETMDRVLDYLEKKFVGLPIAKAKKAAVNQPAHHGKPHLH